MTVAVVRRFIVHDSVRFVAFLFCFLKSLSEVSTKFLTVTEHIPIEESIAIKTLLLDPQLSMDAIQAIKLRAVGADVCFLDKIVADRAG